jgi:hypothetical protein
VEIFDLEAVIPILQRHYGAGPRRAVAGQLATAFRAAGARVTPHFFAGTHDPCYWAWSSTSRC